MKQNDTKKDDDKLKKIFERQIFFQEKFMGPIDTLVHNQEYINVTILACLDELSEILRETAWKNPDTIKYGWKKNQKLDPEKFKEEIIDLWHFLINLSISSGMDADEVFNRYVGKNDENHKRQENKY